MLCERDAVDRVGYRYREQWMRSGRRGARRAFLGGMDGFGWRERLFAPSPLPDGARQRSSWSLARSRGEIGGATLILSVNLSINPLFRADIHRYALSSILFARFDICHVLDICEPRENRQILVRSRVVSFLFRFLGRYVLAFFHLTVVLIEHQTGSWIWLFIEDPLFKKRIYFITLIARNPWTKFRSTEKLQSNVISELLRTWDEMAQQRFRQRKIRMWTGYGSPMPNNNEKKKKYEKEKKK